MAKKFYVPIDLGELELFDARVQNLPSAPTSPVEGQIYHNTTDHNLHLFDGSSWVELALGGNGAGDVVGPSSATDNAIARYDTTTGKLIQNSGAAITDAGILQSPSGAEVGAASATDGQLKLMHAGSGSTFLVYGNDATGYDDLTIERQYSTSVTSGGDPYASVITLLAPQKQVTISSVTAASDTLTAIRHGLRTGAGIVLESTGTVPSGTAADTPYYVNAVDADTLKIYTTRANAVTGGAAGLVDITSAGSGTINAYLFTGESTLTLKRRAGAMTEFLDIYNNGYDGNTKYGIRVQKRGNGHLRPFAIGSYDGTTNTDLIYLDNIKNWVGIKNSRPQFELDVTGNSHVAAGGSTSQYVRRETTAQFASFVLRTATADEWTFGLRNDSTNDLHFRDNVNARTPLKIVRSTGEVQFFADPTSALGAATKQYVDNAIQGLSWKQNVRAATTANITTPAGGAPSTLDGGSLSTNDRILVKDQSTASQNGIYAVQTLGTGSNGTWVRASDADSSAELVNATVYVSEGTANAGTVWTCTTDATITVGITSLTFAQVNGGTVPVATASVQGKVQLATQAEAEAKTDSAKAIVAADLVNFPLKKTATIGDGTTTAISVTDNLGTTDKIAQVRDGSTNAVVECDITYASDTTTFTFATAPVTNAFKVVIMG